jgi:hypothetical protein
VLLIRVNAASQLLRVLSNGLDVVHQAGGETGMASTLGALSRSRSSGGGGSRRCCAATAAACAAAGAPRAPRLPAAAAAAAVLLLLLLLLSARRRQGGVHSVPRVLLRRRKALQGATAIREGGALCTATALQAARLPGCRLTVCAQHCGGSLRCSRSQVSGLRRRGLSCCSLRSCQLSSREF